MSCQTSPAGEGVQVGVGKGSVLVRRLVVVVELCQADREEGEAAEGEDQHRRHHQLGPMLLENDDCWFEECEARKSNQWKT